MRYDISQTGPFGALLPRDVLLDDAARRQTTTLLDRARADGMLTDEEADQRRARLGAARTRSDLGPVLADLPNAAPPPALVAALRVFTLLWLGVSCVQFATWALIVAIGRHWSEPWWWLSVAVTGAAIVVGLRRFIDRNYLVGLAAGPVRRDRLHAPARANRADPHTRAGSGSPPGDQVNDTVRAVPETVPMDAPNAVAVPEAAEPHRVELADARRDAGPAPVTDSAAPVRLDEVSKVYGSGHGAVRALDGVTMDFPRGSFTAVMGPSGSGKSTLLHCAAGLDEPTSGSVTLAGTPLAGMDEAELSILRRDHAAFIFQSFNLMPALTVHENVTLPTTLAGRRPDEQWVSRVIDGVGLARWAGHRPSELSGGQQQRVAIARALASRSMVTFADEPTGALDSQTAREVLGLLREQSRATGQTIVMVTHDPIAASYADRVLFLVDGRVVSQLPGPTAETVTARMAELTDPARRRVGQTAGRMS